MRTLLLQRVKAFFCLLTLLGLPVVMAGLSGCAGKEKAPQGYYEGEMKSKQNTQKTGAQ
jgi:hypothetical protein